MEETTEKWVVDVKEKLQEMDSCKEVEHWKKRSIYRVPAYVVELNRKAYKPQIVSFGPYHHGEDDLARMEDHKGRALLHFLKRSNKAVEAYMGALQEVVQELMDSYDGLDPKWCDPITRFLRLMLMDGCFMLEVLRTATGTSSDYAFNDPIFSHHGQLHIIPYIRRDMLMLQNQLPMLLLEMLVSVETGRGGQKENEEFLNKMIVRFCNPSISPGQLENMGACLHVLDVYRKSLLQEPRRRKGKPRRHEDHEGRRGGGGGGGGTSTSTSTSSSGDIIRSATELDEAGVRFKSSKSRSLKDISFHGGVLRLPVIIVDDTTESTFLNLMAFERFHVGAGNEVTSYIFFMDNIIDSSKDVSKLHSRGIIQNAIGSDKAVAKLFNELSKDVTLDPDSRLDKVHKKVNGYCRKRWNEWRANLIHTYFRSPWAILSLVAAIFLMVLTVAQTIYTVYPYYHNRDTPPPPPPPSNSTTHN
ncbi:hypothetical protein Syun_024677 [Stephania yunnanensis]|uniref:Uncharacterized protein n=1 Tax=Stephania yunnanensis TaxID=152371 RepID=A0AAP0I4S8_9MAGN